MTPTYFRVVLRALRREQLLGCSAQGSAQTDRCLAPFPKTERGRHVCAWPHCGCGQSTDSMRVLCNGKPRLVPPPGASAVFASGMLPTYFPNTFPPQPGGSPRELATAPRDSALPGLNCWEEKLFPPGSIHPAWHLPSPAGGNVLQNAPPTLPSTATESWTQFHHSLIGTEKWDQVPCGSVSQEMGSEMHHHPHYYPNRVSLSLPPVGLI